MYKASDLDPNWNHLIISKYDKARIRNLAKQKTTQAVDSVIRSHPNRETIKVWNWVYLAHYQTQYSGENGP